MSTKTVIRTYSYGAKAPVENAERIDDQLSQAHRYYNRLVEIEKQRQEARFIALKAAEIKFPEWCATNREKKNGDAILLAIDEMANALVRIARTDSEVYWGTYLVVEEAVRRASKRTERIQEDAEIGRLGPKFKRWDWNGQIATQIQKGISTEKLLAGQDTRARIVGEGKHRQLWIRIGSEGRKPIWGVLPFVYHRDLPADAIIKWVRAHRYRIGTKLKWNVQFVLSVDKTKVALPPSNRGTVAVDVGWRKLPSGEMRVAVWVDDENRQGELRIPKRLLDRWRKTNDLRSIRDQNFNLMRDTLVQARRAGADWPEWLQERTRYLYAWKAIAKLAALALQWRNERFPGDVELYRQLEAWRKQDKHLLEWEANQRENVLAARRELYRLFALQLARYGRVVIENLDLRDFAEKPKKEEAPDRPITKAARPNRFKAALSELLGCIVSAVMRTNGELLEQDPEYTTQLCYVCRQPEPFDAAPKIEHTCRQCGAVWDQDVNAAQNLLRATQCGQITSKRSRRKNRNENGETAAEKRRRRGLETRRQKALDRAAREMASEVPEL